MSLLNRLDTRIATLFLGLLLVVQLAGFGAIRHAIDRNARAAVGEDLDNGERIVAQLLEQHHQRMTESARLLTADFGFREAIATGDRATLADVLENHGERIGAAEMLFLSTDLNLQAATAGLPRQVYDRAREQAAAAAPATGARVVLVRDSPQLLLTVPIKAPLTIGWVAMGFPLDQRLLDDIFNLSGIVTSIVVRDPGGHWTLNQTRFAQPSATDLRAQVARLADTSTLEISGALYQTRRMSLAQDGSIDALLMRSIDAVLQPFERLQLLLLLITLVAMALSAAASWLTARHVTEPLKALTRSAERLSAGDYDSAVDVRGQDEVGELARRFETMRIDIRERDQRISKLAYWDRLTGLPNREQFNQRLTQAIAVASAQAQPLTVLMLDLDRFKHVNDVLGPAFGDRLLAQVAQRLRGEAIRATDEIARIGGDEFAVLLPATDRPGASAIAQAIQTALEKPITLDQQTVDLRAGIGAVIYPDDGADAQTLLRRVEIAMYSAKRQQTGFASFEPAMDVGSEQSLSLLSELREAVNQNQLQLYLQPKVALRDGSVIGAEALIRWRHPVRGMVPPIRFIPFAEQTGAIRQITQWMIEQTLRTLADFRDRGLPLKVAVNLSTKDLMDQHLPDTIAQALIAQGLAPSALCLEITESAIMDDPVRAEQTLQRLHDIGLALSIDDFGTGYSSLAYLKRLPVSQLKIDRSFVMDMESDDADVTIVRSTIDLAHNLGLRVVAEGVETERALAMLRELGCDEAQGYFIGRPMPATEFLNWVSAWQAPNPPFDPTNAQG